VLRTAILPALALLCLAGCRSGNAPTGQVAGTVTFEGKAVPQGRVTFQHPDTGYSDEALLNKDGTFAIQAPMPVGDYKVYIIPLVVREQVDRRGPEVGVEQKAADIPEKYRTIGGTDLTATVKEGKNDIVLNMKR
jgi:hypothetical protein